MVFANILQDLLRFYFFAFLLQLCIFMLYAAKAGQHPESAQQHLNRVVNIFIAAAPTGVPTVIIAALAYCILHLQSQDLLVLLPEKIKTSADVEVVCFDKTGTLTGTTVSFCLLDDHLPIALPFSLPFILPGIARSMPVTLT